jgi:hypothetical protein
MDRDSVLNIFDDVHAIRTASVSNTDQLALILAEMKNNLATLQAIKDEFIKAEAVIGAMAADIHRLIEELLPVVGLLIKPKG